MDIPLPPSEFTVLTMVREGVLWSSLVLSCIAVLVFVAALVLLVRSGSSKMSSYLRSVMAGSAIGLILLVAASIGCAFIALRHAEVPDEAFRSAAVNVSGSESAVEGFVRVDDSSAMVAFVDGSGCAVMSRDTVMGSHWVVIPFRSHEFAVECTDPVGVPSP